MRKTITAILLSAALAGCSSGSSDAEATQVATCKKAIDAAFLAIFNSGGTFDPNKAEVKAACKGLTNEQMAHIMDSASATPAP